MSERDLGPQWGNFRYLPSELAHLIVNELFHSQAIEEDKMRTKNAQRSDVRIVTPKRVMNIVKQEKQEEYIDLLEMKHHGEPQCPDIVKNAKRASSTKPQAWEQLFGNKKIWMYNFPGLIAEAKYCFPDIVKTEEDLKKVVFEVNDFMIFLSGVPGLTTEEKAQALNIPISGWRKASENNIVESGISTGVWTSSSHPNGDGIYCMTFGTEYRDITKGKVGRATGLPIRFRRQPTK